MSILDTGHKAALEEVRKEAPASINVDVNLKGVEASVDVTRRQWTLTAYARRVWAGAWSAGARLSRPLGLFSRSPR
jgi:hypothetical protein